MTIEASPVSLGVGLEENLKVTRSSTEIVTSPSSCTEPPILMYASNTDPAVASLTNRTPPNACTSAFAMTKLSATIAPNSSDSSSLDTVSPAISSAT